MFELLKAMLRWINYWFQTNSDHASTSSSSVSTTPASGRATRIGAKTQVRKAASVSSTNSVNRPSTNPPTETNPQYFPWPNTAAHGGKGNLSTAVFTTKEGLLSYCGYKVGANGLPLDARRKILDAIFLSPLPPIDDPDYRAQWGQPRTAKRLQKLAETMAAFVRNAKRRNAARMEKSIREWESDLAYLKRRYYDNRFNFPWPPTTIDKM